jgi:multidrug transporter EmrE-like cation transporter
MSKIILYTLVYAAFSVSGSTLIKRQLNGKSLETLNEWFELMFNLSFVLGFLLIVFSALTFFKALSAGSFSVIIPIATGIHFILTIGVDYFLFQSKLSGLSFIGFILIISGIIVLSLNNQAHA